MRRILIGGSYVGAVAAGAVASAQLWMHALSTDESAAIREVALPGSQTRNVPSLVEPLRPNVARPSVSPSPFTGFIPIFASNGSGPAGGETLAPGSPAPGLPSPGSPVPGTPVPGTPAPGQPTAPTGGGTGITASGPQSGGQGPTASAARPPTSSNGGGSTTSGQKNKPKHSSARATPAVRAQRARPPASKPATPATPAIPPSHPKPDKPKPDKPKPDKQKPDKPPKQKDTTPAAQITGPPPPTPSEPSGHGNGGGNGQGNGKEKGKK
jgi:hypothetical protein